MLHWVRIAAAIGPVFEWRGTFRCKTLFEIGPPLATNAQRPPINPLLAIV
jgi:hypothetical protein